MVQYMQDASGSRFPYTGQVVPALMMMAPPAMVMQPGMAPPGMMMQPGMAPPGMMMQPGMAPATAVQFNPLVQPVKY